MNEKDIKEILQRMYEQGMAPQPFFEKVPVLNMKIACGKPSELGDTGIDFFRDWPKELVNSISAVAVRVTGNSMEGAGYIEGDEVMVEVNREAEDGDVVAVLLDGESMIKGLMFDENRQPWLIPQNKNYKAIAITEESDLRILGVVTGLYRRKQKLSTSDMIGYLMKAKVGGRPRSRALAGCITEQHLKQLHHAIDGRSGKDVVQVIKYAADNGWFTSDPKFPAVLKEFGQFASRQLYSRYMGIDLTENEIKSIEEALKC